MSGQFVCKTCPISINYIFILSTVYFNSSYWHIMFTCMNCKPENWTSLIIILLRIFFNIDTCVHIYSLPCYRMGIFINILSLSLSNQKWIIILIQVQCLHNNCIYFSSWLCFVYISLHFTFILYCIYTQNAKRIMYYNFKFTINKETSKDVLV